MGFRSTRSGCPESMELTYHSARVRARVSSVGSLLVSSSAGDSIVLVDESSGLDLGERHR